MRLFLIVALLVAALLPCTADAATKGATANGQWIRYTESSDNSTLLVLSPMWFCDEFIGNSVDKYVGTTPGNAHAVWKTVETNLNTAIGLSTDATPGVVSIAMDADNNAERGVLYFGDNECLNLYAGVGFEARVQFSAAPTTATTMIIGLAGDDNSTSDSVDVHAWFKLLGTAGTALLWETDDGTTDDDDNAAATVTTATWYVFRIEVYGDNAFFFVDGALVGKGSLAAVSSTTGKVQPYIAVQKASGTGVGTLLVDYVKVWGAR